MFVATEAPPTEVVIQAGWQETARNLVLKGGDNFDQAIELVCRHEHESLRAERLKEWGLADAERQLAAWAFFRSDLEPTDPLQKLTNSQRTALFCVDFHDVPSVLDAARTHLASGMSQSRITEAWAKAQVTAKRLELKNLADKGKTVARRTTPSEARAIAEAKLADTNEELESLREENQELKKLIVKLDAQLLAFEQNEIIEGDSTDV